MALYRTMQIVCQCTAMHLGIEDLDDMLWDLDGSPRAIGNDTRFAL